MSKFVEDSILEAKKIRDYLCCLQLRHLRSILPIVDESRFQKKVWVQDFVKMTIYKYKKICVNLRCLQLRHLRSICLKRFRTHYALFILKTLPFIENEAAW